MQFVNAHGKESAPFYFWDNKPHECSQTWQVVRSEFDQMLLDNAREHGVDAYDGVHVVEVLFERAISNSDGALPGWRSSRTASAGDQGQGRRRRQRPGAMLMNRMKLRVWDPVLNKGAIWTYWEGAYRDTGRDEGATMVLQTPGRDGWFWCIRSTTTSSRWASWRRSITCSRAARAITRPPTSRRSRRRRR